MKSLHVCFLFCLSAAPAMAQITVMDGNSLQSQCVYLKQAEAHQALSQADFGSAMFCLGYIRAALDSIAMDAAKKVRRVDKDGELKHPCIPETVTNDQNVKIVVKYLDDNPAELHWSATTLVLKAMTNAFPCH